MQYRNFNIPIQIYNFISKHTPKGYVLLDAIIGIGLLSVVIISNLYVFSESIRGIEEIKQQTIASVLAQGKMEEISASFNLSSDKEGDFLPNHPGFSWVLEKIP